MSIGRCAHARCPGQQQAGGGCSNERCGGRAALCSFQKPGATQPRYVPRRLAGSYHVTQHANATVGAGWCTCSRMPRQSLHAQPLAHPPSWTASPGKVNSVQDRPWRQVTGGGLRRFRRDVFDENPRWNIKWLDLRTENATAWGRRMNHCGVSSTGCCSTAWWKKMTQTTRYKVSLDTGILHRQLTVLKAINCHCFAEEAKRKWRWQIRFRCVLSNLVFLLWLVTSRYRRLTFDANYVICKYELQGFDQFSTENSLWSIGYVTVISHIILSNGRLMQHARR